MLRRSKPTNRAPIGFAFDHRNGEVVVADFSADGHSYDLYRAPIDERRSVNIETGDLRTTLLGGNAHTDQLRNVTADDSDETILNAVLALAAENSHNAFSYSRTRDGRVLVTQVDRTAVNDIATQVARWYEQQQVQGSRAPEPSLTIETRTRAIARVWSLSTNGQSSPGETTAFLVLGRDDYSFGLWSETTGLVYETEEKFETGAILEDKCDHARNMLCRLINPSTLDGLHLPPVSRVIVSAPGDTIAPLIETLRATDELHNQTDLNSHLFDIEVSQITLDLGGEAPNVLDQPTALAIGSIIAAGDGHNVPVCDLMVAPEDRLALLKQQTETLSRAARSGQAVMGALAVLAPLVAMIAFMVTCMADQGIERARLQSRINVEVKASEKLAKENADYESQKANFSAFNGLLNYLITLRTRQPAAHQLLRDLNQRWPADSTWYVSEVNVKGGQIEIKGKTKNEQAITAFAKALEFSDGLFTNILTKTNAQGNTATPSQITATPASTIIEFNILATYAPLASPGKVIAPPAQADSQQPVAPKLPNMNPLSNVPVPSISPAPQTPGSSRPSDMAPMKQNGNQPQPLGAN